MYVILSTFCFAIIVFVVSCYVYASKHKMINFENSKDRPVVGGGVGASAIVSTPSATGHFPMLRESRKRRDSTTNAHNWVWLGRSTMDRSSMHEPCEQHFVNPRGKLSHIIHNHSGQFHLYLEKLYRNIFYLELYFIQSRKDSRIRITRNPIPANYMDAHDSIQQVSTFDDFNRISRDVRFSTAGPSYR